MPHTLVLQLMFLQQTCVTFVYDCSVCMPCFRMYGEYFTMPRMVTSSDGGERLAILLSLRIGGGACPAGGVGDLPHVSF